MQPGKASSSSAPSVPIIFKGSSTISRPIHLPSSFILLGIQGQRDRGFKAAVGIEVDLVSGLQKEHLAGLVWRNLKFSGIQPDPARTVGLDENPEIGAP